MPCDLTTVAAKLKAKMSNRRAYGLVVVAEGAKIAAALASGEKAPENTLKATLSPLASGDNSTYVIQRSGQAAETVASRLQLLIAEETFPLVIGLWARGGAPTAVDRQLGLAYSAGAIQALQAGQDGVMVAFVPPHIQFVPLADAINKIRTVPADNEFLKTARSLGICLGS
jgi:6-phosphofructokinase 1